MADTTFVTGTVIPVAWLNDINDVVYTVLAASGSVPATAAALRANIGSLTVGDAVFIATSAAVARAALGSTTVGDAVFIAASTAAARTALAAAGSGAVTASGLTQTTARLLGRTTAATGAIEEITVGASFTGIALSAGNLGINLLTNSVSLSADVTLANTGLYYDGPSVAQGSTGTWLAVGIVTLVDASAARNFNCKLWDGTTVLSSCTVSSAGAGSIATATLMGVLASPAGNLRISVNEPAATGGKILFNQSGLSKDSTIQATKVGP